MYFFEFRKVLFNFSTIIRQIFTPHGHFLTIHQGKFIKKILDRNILVESNTVLIKGKENKIFVKEDCKVEHLIF
jgi:hypothetical protein